MRIAISTVMDSAKSGAWQVIKNIILQLKEIDQKNEYVIFVESTYEDDFGDLPDNFEIVRSSITAAQSLRNIFWHGFILPVLLKKYQVDMLHLPWHSAALIRKTKPVVLSILDLTEYVLPGHYSKSRVLYRKLMIPYSSRKADKIVAISQYTKKEIVCHLGIEDKKIEVVYCAPHERYRQIDEIEAKQFIYGKYEITKPFILYVGQIQHPNKNILRLLDAFRQAKDALEKRYQLVLCGKRHSSADIIFNTVKDQDLTKDVIFTGYIPDKDLPYFYNAASLFVYPSLFEGFGIPVIEAMACGAPVVTSNVSALTEVAGDAAVLVDPLSVPSIASGIKSVLSDPIKRGELKKKALEQAKHFSWRKSAEQMVQVYRSVLKSE